MPTHDTFGRPFSQCVIGDTTSRTVRASHIRDLCLAHLEAVLPDHMTDLALLPLVQLVYPDLTLHDLRRELDYLAEQSLLRVQQSQHRWRLKLIADPLSIPECSARLKTHLDASRANGKTIMPMGLAVLLQGQKPDPFPQATVLSGAAALALLPLAQAGLVTFHADPAWSDAEILQEVMPRLHFLGFPTAPLIRAAWAPRNPPATEPPSPSAATSHQTASRHCPGGQPGHCCPGCPADAAPPPVHTAQNAAPQSAHPAGHPTRAGSHPGCSRIQPCCSPRVCPVTSVAP